MKTYNNKFMLIVLTLWATLQFVQAQESIELTELRIKRETSTFIKVGDPEQTMINNFGIPNISEEYYYEMDETLGMRHFYGNNQFYFIDEKLDAWELVTHDFKVGLKGSYIAVGDNISTIATIYPNYLSRIKEDYISIPFKYNDQLLDTTLIVEFNPATQLITKIMRYDP